MVMVATTRSLVYFQNKLGCFLSVNTAAAIIIVRYLACLQ